MDYVVQIFELYWKLPLVTSTTKTHPPSICTIGWICAHPNADTTLMDFLVDITSWERMKIY